MTQRNTAEIRLGAWYAEEVRSLAFPEGWEVHCLGPDDAPAIDDEAVRAALRTPGARLREATIHGRRVRVRVAPRRQARS